MNRTLVVLGLAALVFLAGCGGEVAQDGTTTVETTAVDTTGADTPTSSSQSTTTSKSEAMKIENPYGKETLIVGIDAPQNRTVDFVAAAQNATEFWNTHPGLREWEHEEPVQLKFKPNATTPDVTLTYMPTIEFCGDEYSDKTFYFCTETYEEGEEAPSAIDIEVASRYTQSGVEDVTRESLAGLYGFSDFGSYKFSPPDELALRDPWPETDHVVVGVNKSANPERNFTPLVRKSVEYWEEHPEYGNYTVDFVVRPNASDPDIEVRLVRDIETCGLNVETTEFTGCAPVIDKNQTAEELEVVQIQAGYTDKSTLGTLKHEFGHIHGLGHDVEPMPLMDEVHERVQKSAPDAADRANPWQDTSIEVYFDSDGGVTADDKKDEVDEVISYFNSHPEYLPSDTKLKLVDNEDDADIVVKDTYDPSCRNDAGSCPEIWGVDKDRDDALEVYTFGEVQVKDIDSDRFGWHVGYWIDRMVSPATTSPEWDNPDDDRENWG